MIISGGNIYTETETLQNSTIHIEDGIIRSIERMPKRTGYPSTGPVIHGRKGTGGQEPVPGEGYPVLGRQCATQCETLTDNNLHLPDNWHVIPGMIDMHIHGAAGADTMDATPEALETISQALLQEGVTSFVATTMTAAPKHIENALRCIAQYKNQLSGATLLGIHLEGPFISPEKIGAQNTEYLQTPDVDLLKHWQDISDDLLKIVTLAPELPGALACIEHLCTNHIIASAGHSNADYETMQTAMSAGISHATHLFNAMTPIHHRQPGGSIALLLDPRVTVELIADGIHLHPAMLQLVTQNQKKCVLITDAMRAKGLPDGTYDLGGQPVHVKNHQARLSNNALAGSTLTMDQALRNMLQYTHCSMHDVIHMTSTTPAKKLGCFHQKGSIALHKDADLTILDENLHVQYALSRGKIKCSKKND